MFKFEDKEKFIKDYKELKSSRKMAELYGCSKNTIIAFAKKIGYDYADNKELKITSFPIEQIISDYEELKSAKRVGEKYKCSGTAVLQYLKKNNYEPKNFNAKLSSISPEDFCEIYDQLKSAEKVGKYYNCSSTAILEYAKKINYDVNSNKDYKLSLKDKEEILQAYNSSTTSSELAKKYSVSRGMITKLWYDAGYVGKEIDIHNNFKDITGQQFGKWTVLYKTDKRGPSGAIYWHCRCSCGVERDVLSCSLLQGLSTSCGAHGNNSKGNEKIKELLTAANIPFELEKKFDTCKDKKELPFDFYVNNSYLIEYDGIQHFWEDSLFDYNYTHEHDLIKSQWCKENNISLIRIPYTHFNNLTLEDLILEKSNYVEYYADDKLSKIGGTLQI